MRSRYAKWVKQCIPVDLLLGASNAAIHKRAAILLFLVLSIICPAQAQYLGVTCGWQYSSQLAGPLAHPDQFNISLYNPDPNNPDATWDDWAEQLAQAGVDFVCPNLTGSYPNAGGSPVQMAPLLTALSNRGLTNQIKFAIFDDNASSWVAQWNLANGRGYGYAEKFDISNTNNWKYIYDYNYKLFYQTIPDANRFKINGRPLIIIWTGNTVTFLTNMQGNASQAITYVRQCCQRDFGFNPYIVLSDDFFINDTTCNNAGIADASESWFIAGPTGPSYTLTTKNGTKVGVAVSEFQHTGQNGFLNPNHGQLFQTGLSNTVDANALLTLCEGFTDYEEDAAMWRARDLDTNWDVLSYDQTLYDYPNERLNALRQHSNRPFPSELKFEAEGCDYFGGAAGGNGRTNYYRNGNIAIEPTSDIGGGFDVGWIQPGEWLEWEDVPIQGSQVHLQVRIASPNNNAQYHFVIDGTNYPEMNVPETGGYQVWATSDAGPYQFSKGGTHTVTLVCDTGGFNINYWQYHDDIPIGVNVSLQSQVNSKWVSAAAGTLNANVNVPGTSETFTVVDASSGYGYGYVALQALSNNEYVTADTNGVLPLAASATAVGPSQIFQWTDDGDGTITLRALADSKLVSVTNNPSSSPLIPNQIRNPGSAQTFLVNPVSTNLLSFVAPPNNTVEGEAITAGALNEVQVLALNGSGNPVSGVPVTISIASGGGTISGPSATTDDNGIAHFTDLQINLTGAKTFLASSSAFQSSTSSSFNITAGAASALTVETEPDGSGTTLSAQNIAAGSSVEAFAIYRDSVGNFVTNTAATWSLVNTTGGVMGSDLVASADGRSAAFTGHVIGTAQIQAAAAFNALSGTQTVTAGSAASLVISQQPSAVAKVGLPFAQQPIISETDGFGNPSISPITVVETGGMGSVNRNPNGVTIAPVNGVGTFSGLYLTNLGVSSVTFTAGAASIQSGNITMNIGNVEQLVWTTQPGQATNGFTFGTPPIIQTADAGGNVTTLGLPAVKYALISIYSGTGALFGTVMTNIGTAGGNGTVVLTNLGITLPGVFQLSVQDIGNAYNPTNISAANNCQLWLDAADGTTLNGASAGSTVSFWNDKSGHANNATGAATLVIDPLLSATSPGQAYAVHFNGSQQLAMNLNSLSNSPYTILVMEVGTSKSGGSSYFIGNNGGYNTDLTLGVGYQTATQFRWQQYADDLNYNASFTNVMARQWTMNLNAASTISKNLYLNSTLVGTASSGFLTGPNLVNGTVGCGSYLGDVAEIVVYNASLNINDQTNLQNYLDNKWLTGLSPATTQPFAVIAPVYRPSFNYVAVNKIGGVPFSIAFSGINGPTNGTYIVLSSTNISAPLSTWSPVLTNLFNGNGAFSNTVPIDGTKPMQFYRLVQP